MKRWLERELAALAKRGLLRDASDHRRRSAEQAATRLGVAVLDAATNDYLGLNRSSVLAQSLTGAGASRLVHGEASEHVQLEHAVARWLRRSSALLFPSGFAANAGSLPALAGKGDLICSDELNHASLIDGCRLSSAKVERYQHLDMDDLQRALALPCEGRRWIVTESYYSMDGDGPNLGALARIAKEHDAALFVDEAHAVGVFGPRGAGLCASQNVAPEVLTFGMGKALALQGGCVTGSDELRTWLYNRARTFVYSTAPSPGLSEACRHRLDQVIRAESERARLGVVAATLRQRLTECGLQITPASGPVGPIVPVVLGSAERAMAAADALTTRGILVQAIRPPTVPEGAARLRLTAKANFADNDLDRLVEEVAKACAP